MIFRGLRAFIRDEWFLVFSAGTGLIFLLTGETLLDRLASPPWLAFILFWLFATVLGSALCVVRHADHLAVRLGEPYGTLVLTLSVTCIEVVSISAVMMQGKHNPTLTRDTLFAVVMIILNGMVGLSLLLGGWKHNEQHYNLQGANAYLGVIIPLVVLSMILPDFTLTTPGPTLSFGQGVFLVLVFIGLFATFLAMQTGRHRGYFTLRRQVDNDAAATTRPRSLAPHVVLLIAYMIPVVFLAEQLAHPVAYLIDTLHAPAPLAGVLLAILVAAPEAIGAVRAAVANDLQRAINIFLGSVLATIGLTVPAMVIVSDAIGQNMVLGVEHTDMVLLLLTLAVSVVTFASGRTNVIQGAVHVILFATYLMLLVQG